MEINFSYKKDKTGKTESIAMIVLFILIIFGIMPFLILEIGLIILRRLYNILKILLN